MIFSLIYFCFIFFLFGLYFNEILHLYRPLANPVEIINGFIIYLIPIHFTLQFLIQRNNLRILYGYLHLPIRRSKLIAYSLFLKQFNLINFLILFFVVPYSWVNILPNYGWTSFLLFLYSFWLLIVFLTNFSIYLHNLSYKHLILSSLILIFIILKYILKTKFDIEIGSLTHSFFKDILNKNYINIILLTLLTFLIILGLVLKSKQSFYFLIENYDKRRINIKPSRWLLLNKSNNNYNFLELSLIIRNKRTRGIFLITVYMLILTYIVFLINPFQDTLFVFFWCICIIGMWGYSYIQFIFSFESSFMDFIVTRNFDFTKYLLAKYFQIIIISFILFLAITPFAIMGILKIHILVTAFLYNISIGFLIVFITATFNKKRMDLNKGLVFNYQGHSPIQIATIYFVILLPVVFLGLMTLFLNYTIGFLIINLVSIISLLGYKYWFKIIVSKLLKRKYINLKGYRE